MKYIVVVLISILAIGCSDRPGNSSEKLDVERGFQGLVLGDSVYNTFYALITKNAREWEVNERELLGNAMIGVREYESLDHRFVYGVLLENLYAGSFNGGISHYSFLNQDSDTTAQRRLLDSLIMNYGEPQINWDSLYVNNGESTNVWEKKWEGNTTFLSYSWNDRGTISLQVGDIASLEAVENMRQQIEDFKVTGLPSLDTLQKVGKFNLYSTKSDVIDRYNASVEERKSALSDDIIRDYNINYSKYLQEFFEIENKKRYSSNSFMAIEAEVAFAEKTDSLTHLEISFETEVEGSNSWTDVKFVDYSDVLTAVGRRLGQYSFEEKLHTNEGVYRRAFWIGKGLIVMLEEPSYSDTVELTFYVNRQPFQLIF